MESVGQRLVGSAGWAIASDVSVLLSSTAAAIVAARLLPKSEIGLVGTVTLLVALLETLTASGVEQALVHRDQHDERLFDTGWTWQLLRGFAIGAVLLLAAPSVARFYGQPELLAVTAVLAAQPVLRGAANIRVVMKTRALDFRALFFLNAAPALLRLATVVTLCFSLRTAWALIAGTLIEHAARLFLSFALVPRRPRLRLDRGELSSLWRYGRFITGLSILTYLNTRGDDLFVSKRFGAGELAAYQLAFGLANAPVTGISHVIGRVAFPAYSRLQHDAERLRRAFLEGFRMTVLAAFVVATALFFAFPFLPVVVGPQWSEAIAVGQALAAGGAVRALLNTASPLFQGTGRPGLDLRMNLPRLIVLAALIVPLADAFGLYGVSLASLASVCMCLPFWLLGVRSQTGLRAGQIARMCASALLPGILALAVFGALSWLLPRDLIGLLVFAVAGAGLTYAGVRGCERLTGIVLMPSLARLRAL